MIRFVNMLMMKISRKEKLKSGQEKSREIIRDERLTSEEDVEEVGLGDMECLGDVDADAKEVQEEVELEFGRVDTKGWSWERGEGRLELDLELDLELELELESKSFRGELREE